MSMSLTYLKPLLLKGDWCLSPPGENWCLGEENLGLPLPLALLGIMEGSYDGEKDMLGKISLSLIYQN